MLTKLIGLYTTEQSARLTIYGLTLFLTILYGIVANVVIGRPEREVTFEAAGLTAVLLVTMSFGYASYSAKAKEAQQKSQGAHIAAVLRWLTLASVLLEIVLPSPKAVLIPILLMIVYALVGARQAKTTGEQVRLADQIFFVGYLATIAAFGSVLVRVGWAGVLPTDLTSLASALGSGLSATTAALIISTILRQTGKTKLPGTDLTSLTAAIEELYHEHTADEGINTGAALDELKRHLAVLTYALTQAEDSAEEQKKNAEELRKTLDEFIKAVARRQESRPAQR